MLPSSSLSTAAYNLRRLFLQHVDDLDDINQIRIGHPADNLKDLEDTDEHCLNLFFYDVVFDGYPADVGPDNPFYVRLHCLITAIGHKTTEPESPGSASDRDVSKGENELRLIGEVMRIMHEQPLLMVTDADGNDIAMLQMVPHAINLDNLNHIWSTQTDISYRLSVAYEMALAPVPNASPSRAAPLVADSSMVAWGAMSREASSERDGIITVQPGVDFLRVDTGLDNWTPHICYLETLVDASQELHYVHKITGDLDSPLDILVAGRAGGTVTLFWKVWRKLDNDSVVAWEDDIADLQVPLEKNIAAASDSFDPAVIDPDNILAEGVFQALLPDNVKAVNTKTWQAELTAVHEWSHEDPMGGGTVTTPITSNTVLFYGDSP